MSIVQLSRQTIAVPGRAANIGEAQGRSQASRPPALAVPYGRGKENNNIASETFNSKKSLEPIDKSQLKLAVLKQYNDIVGEDGDLTCRSLPPVKLSVKLSKTKFVDTPRAVDTASTRILKPLLTMKTHTAGHHVFTEGISKKSKLPNPTFALPQMRVPYSNLPENVMIYKEKNKFAFGVKRDQPEPSPYRLTPKPPDVPSLQLHVTFPATDSKRPDEGGRQVMSDRPRNRTQLKSNKIVLDPILPSPKVDGVKSGSNSSQSLRPAKEPLAPNNSFLGYESPVKSMTNGIHTDREDRRLSIVSIGDTVTQSIYERQKRNTRKLYPMYDYKSRQDEVIKRAKFGGIYDSAPSKTEEPGSSYTYKVSSRSLEFARSDSMGTVSPIKNNIRNRPPPLVNPPRGLGSYRRYAKNGHEYEEPSYHEQKFRRLYRRTYYPPNTPDSNNSTEMSFLPGNPPPSVTSHILSEDVPQNFAEFKNEMITLLEEKEKTVSVFSMNTSDKKERESSKDEDKTFVNADIVLEDAPTDTARSDGYETQTDTDIQMETMNTRLADERRYVRENTLNEEDQDASRIATARAESVKQETRDVVNIMTATGTNESKTEKTEKNEKQTITKLINHGHKAAMLTVPTFSLDTLSHHPLGGTVRERTSLSRSIQNMTVSDTKPSRTDASNNGINEYETDKAIGSLKDNKVSMSVTELRLFSGSPVPSPGEPCPPSPGPSLNLDLDTPRVSITDENGDKFDIDYTSKPPENVATEKRLVANANIQFISPLISETKAKRQ